MTTSVCATSDSLVGVQADENNSDRELYIYARLMLYPSIPHEYQIQEQCSVLEK